MKIRTLRISAFLLILYTVLSPSMLVNKAMAQDSNLFVAAWSNLGLFHRLLVIDNRGYHFDHFQLDCSARKAFIKMMSLIQSWMQSKGSILRC